MQNIAATDVAAFAHDLEAIIARPRHRHARFGVAIHALADGAVLFERDADSYFAGASTTKLPTVANALAHLGPDYRFRTILRHTGSIDDAGTLRGDLVLVASGDPNLSARVRPDDTLDFADIDHALGGEPNARAVPGDPLQIVRKLVDDLAARGITRIAGDVRIDISLFAEGYRELGTFAVVSPIVINDNLIDILARAGSVTGEPLELTFSPATRYITFRSSACAGEPGSAPALTISAEHIDADGERLVEIGGTLPPGATLLYNHPVDSPSAFARTLLLELLAERGIAVHAAARQRPSRSSTEPYAAGDALAEHLSPPFREAAKIINKVSQNLHAELCPRIVGAVTAGATGQQAEAAGFARQIEFFATSGIDTDGIVQGDACGALGYFTPAFMCRFLRRIADLPFAAAFRASLPVMGRDGTLHAIQVDSPAAGAVFAKTGTMSYADKLRPRAIVAAKGLAGYIDASSGNGLVFAVYANMVALGPDDTAADVGQALGEIAAAAYTHF